MIALACVRLAGRAARRAAVILARLEQRLDRRRAPWARSPRCEEQIEMERPLFLCYHGNRCVAEDMLADFL